MLWNNFRGGTAAAGLLAIDAGVVYVQDWDGTGGMLYRLDAATGRYLAWTGSDTAILAIKTLWGNDAKKPQSADAMDVKNGRLYLAFTPADAILVVDSNSGKLIKQLHVAKPSDVKVAAGKLYAVSEGKAVLTINPETGETATLIAGLRNAQAMASTPRAKSMWRCASRTIRSSSSTPTASPPEGDRSPGGAEAVGALDARRHGVYCLPDGGRPGQAVGCRGRLCAQAIQLLGYGERPVGEGFFRPHDLWRAGGAINPQDPYLMVGQGCEWRIDPQTGRADCLGVITRDGMEVSRFGIGSNGKLYLAVATRWTFELAVHRDLRTARRRQLQAADHDHLHRSRRQGYPRFFGAPSAHEPGGENGALVR